jgi:hypothetical protein
LSDEIIEMKVDKGYKNKIKENENIMIESIKNFEFIIICFRADTIAALYKIRWQNRIVIQTVKQNFPLKYFFRRQ